MKDLQVTISTGDVVYLSDVLIDLPFTDNKSLVGFVLDTGEELVADPSQADDLVLEYGLDNYSQVVSPITSVAQLNELIDFTGGLVRYV
jgi:hypothetical protein